MEPVFGFALYLFACIVVAIVAAKKGRAWWLYLLLTLVGGPALVILGNMTGASRMGAAVLGFMSPLAGLVMALASSTGEQKAVQDGEFREFRKCPFCAESIRKEAVKCKHCGSEIPHPA